MSEGYDSHGLEKFIFRDIHPKIQIGTASDRYAGWIGQIYTKGRYEISSRSNRVGGKSFKEEVLPVESIKEYFQHFSVLEIDFTFYRPLLDGDLQPTQNYHVLQTYRKYLRENDRIILKVPQVIFAQKLWRGGALIENNDYLNAEIFTHQFYEPAVDILGDLLIGFIFEQEYQRKKERISPKEYVEGLDSFLRAIPKDKRYHIETRTDSYHIKSYFEVLQNHGVGNVLSHWTWLPPLRKQFLKSDKLFYNSGKQSIVRLLTPLRMRYEEAYMHAFPFDKMVEGMMKPQMIADTIEIMKEGIKDGACINVIVNNRAGGNAPLIAKEIAKTILETVLK